MAVGIGLVFRRPMVGRLFLEEIEAFDDPPTLTFEAGRIEGDLKPQTGYHSIDSSQCEIGPPVFEIRRSA
jgi:hypothetical protein